MSKLSEYLGASWPKPVRCGSGGPYEASIGYSRVVRAGGLAWTAGTTAVVDGELQGVGDAEAQARIALDQAVAALERAGVPREFITMSRLYVVDIVANSDAVGRAHGAIFGEIKPVATMVGVTGLVDPRMLVEVELMAAPGRPLRRWR